MFFKIHLFIFGCAASSLLFVGFSPVSVSRGYSSLWFVGFSRWWCLLWSTGSGRVGFSNCSTWAQQLRLPGSGAQAQQLWRTGSAAHSTWDLPRPGVEPVSPALAGRFLSALPSGESLSCPIFTQDNDSLQSLCQ